MNLVDFLSVFDDIEYCFFAKKNINKMVVVVMMINEAPIIKFFTIILQRCAWLCTDVGSLTRRCIESPISMRPSSEESFTTGSEILSCAMVSLKETNTVIMNN